MGDVSMLLETLLKDDPDTEPQGCLGLDVKQAGQPCSPDQPGNPDQPHLEDKDCEAGCPVLGECVRAPPTEQSPYMLQVRWKLGKGPSPVCGVLHARLARAARQGPQAPWQPRARRRTQPAGAAAQEARPAGRVEERRLKAAAG